MSQNAIKEEINRFLSSDIPEVMVIRGEWGIGKTVAWNKFLQEFKKNIRLKKYSYVSLFGLDDINMLEPAIFREMIPKENIGESPTLITYQENMDTTLAAKRFITDNSSRVAKLIQPFRRIKKLDLFYSIFDSVAHFGVNNCIICLDDFERKSDNMFAKNILGIISNLKEKKNCKVVLILNDERLNDNEKEIFKELREKVIDVEVEYLPTPEESAQLVLNLDDYCERSVYDCVTKLKIKNIRIINKINRLAKILYSYLHGSVDNSVIDGGIKSLSLFVWSFCCRNEAPPFDYLNKKGMLDHYLNSARTQPSRMGRILNGTEEEKDKEAASLWELTLLEYEYTYTDDFDLVIAAGVKRGYFDKSLLIIEANKKQNDLTNQKKTKEVQDAWDYFHGQFDGDIDGFIKVIKEAYYKNYSVISLGNVDGAVTRFRVLNRNNDANELIEKLVPLKHDEILSYSSESAVIAVKDTFLLAEIERIKASNVKKPTFEAVINFLIENKGNYIRAGDLEILANASATEYYNLLKQAKGVYLRKIKYIFSDLKKMYSGSSEHKKISSNLKEALEQLTLESDLNPNRVESWLTECF